MKSAKEWALENAPWADDPAAEMAWIEYIQRDAMQHMRDECIDVIADNHEAYANAMMTIPLPGDRD